MAQSLIDFVNTEFKENQKRFIDKTQPFADFLKQGYEASLKQDEERKIKEQGLRDIEYMAEEYEQAFTPREDVSIKTQKDVLSDKFTTENAKKKALEIEKKDLSNKLINVGIEPTGDIKKDKDLFRKYRKSETEKETLFDLNVEAKRKNLSDEETTPKSTMTNADKKTFDKITNSGYDANTIMNDINSANIIKSIQKKPEYEKIVSDYDKTQKEIEALTEKVKGKYEVEGEYFWKPVPKDVGKKIKKNSKENWKYENKQHYQRFPISDLELEPEFDKVKTPDKDKYEEAKQNLEELKQYEVGGVEEEIEIDKETNSKIDIFMKANNITNREDAIKILKDNGII